MKNSASLLALSLLAANSLAWADDERPENDRSEDLRYCLELPTAQQIAKCSGEISAGNKGRTYSRTEVERILAEEKARAPASTDNPSGMPATDSRTSVTELK